MKFGFTLMTTWDAKRTQTQVLDDFVKVCVRGEQLGYWSVSTTEHHMANDPTYKPYGFQDYDVRAYDLSADALTLFAYIAAATKRIRLKTGVVVAHYDHPVRIAERAALLDNLSHGRLEFGIGQGGSQGPREPIIWKIPGDPAAKQRKMIETLDIILKVWSGEEFAYDGEFFQMPAGRYVPTPEYDLVARSMVGSMTPETITWAARHGLGCANSGLAWGYASLDRIIESHNMWRAAAVEAGRDPDKMLNAQHITCYCGETDEEAAEVASKWDLEFVKVISAHSEKSRFNNAPSGALPGDPSDQEKLPELIKTQIETQIIGSPETCIERIKTFQEKFKGLEYVCLVSGYGAIPADKTIASLERFAKYVMPHFASETVPAPAGAR